MTELKAPEINRTIKGKPLSECSYDELQREMTAGYAWQCMNGLSDVQEARLTAVEHELEKRPTPPEDEE